jgi:hypothetical protein
LLDGVCVAESVADYVGCVRAQGANVGGSKGQKISAEAGALGVRASGAAEVKETLEKRYAVSSGAELEIVKACKVRVEPAPPPTGTTSPAPLPSRGTPPPAGRAAIFSEDFQAISEGLVPPDWTADDGVGVMGRGRAKCLGRLQSGDHKIRTSPIAWPSDYRVEVDAQFLENGYMNQFLKVSVAGASAFFGGGYGSDGAGLTGASDAFGAVGQYKSKRVTIAVEKQGPVLRSFIDENRILLSRTSDLSDPGRAPLSIEFSATKDFCIYRVSVFRL